MKVAVIFLLLLPTAHALSIGVSPDEIILGKNTELSLINPNNEAVSYSIRGALEERGSIKKHSRKRIQLNVKKPGFLKLSFNTKSKNLALSPAIKIQIKQNTIPKTRNYGILALSLLFGLGILFIIRKLSLSYSSIE